MSKLRDQMANCLFLFQKEVCRLKEEEILKEIKKQKGRALFKQPFRVKGGEDKYYEIIPKILVVEITKEIAETSFKEIS